MGITWRAMPLLSTLAALVIIVHSAEEDMSRGLDREYQYDIRPRALDTGTPSYDEPWRAVKAEPTMQKSEHMDIWEDSPERPFKRRKPARKRKRRPIAPLEHQEPLHSEENERSEVVRFNTPEIRMYTEASDDIHVVQRYHETDDTLRYRDTQYSLEPTTEMPRRRRKRPEMRRSRWNEDELDIHRPLRRRTQKRKRPSLDNLPRLTEFGEFKQDEESPRFSEYVHDEPFNSNGGEVFDPENIQNKPHDSYQTDLKPETIANEHFEPPSPNQRSLNEDRSLSEFSMEDVGPPENKPAVNTNKQEDQTMGDYRLQPNHKGLSTRTSKLIDKIRGNGPIDPVILKEILKRSNGTSLSEILQQHNLSLSDLLRGKEDIKTMMEIEHSPEKLNDNTAQKIADENSQNVSEQENAERIDREQKEVTPVTEAMPENNESVQVPDLNTDKPNDLESLSKRTDVNKQQNDELKETSSQIKLPQYDEVKETDFQIKLPQNNEVNKTTPKIVTNRRTSGIRRKLRMRPPANGAYKSQLSRDLMAQTARKYHNSRNTTKAKEWKLVVPMMNSPTSNEESNNKNEVIDTTVLTTTSIPEETTVVQNVEYYNPSTILINTQTENEDEDENKQTTDYISTTQEMTTVEMTTTTTTEKPKVSRLRPAASRMGLRQQAFNNRLKRKRMKQKISTTEQPVERDEDGVHLFGIPNLVSSSEFIARTQTPKPTNTESNEEDFTTLDDFMTTEKSRHAENGPRFTRNSSIIHTETEPVKTMTTQRFVSTTEETAKFEIEEILNDTRTSARLSRILMERNMTLSELVEHRERGSSHVHLADIFHNASKEPNPAEPFLSKSLIEPISKETYPLRAILEANLHEAPAKATTDPVPAQTYPASIPVVMDFGNNVNENGENMGIMSLFNKFTSTDISSVEQTNTGKDSEGTPYITTVIAVNNTDNDTTARESRVLKREEENNLKHDVVAWSELFELMRKNYQNETERLKTPDKDAPSKHEIVLQDSDGDGLIVLEDLQRLKDFDVNNNGRLDINSYEADAAVPGILDRAPSHTRSVTVATASIVGLAMILFLLTYAAFKWRQQINLLRKKNNYPDDRIPTPVFENRKGHKNNSSTRSISPMLATSNIYTLNTLDSNGKESPEYMWDSLRKPFQ